MVFSVKSKRKDAYLLSLRMERSHNNYCRSVHSNKTVLHYYKRFWSDCIHWKDFCVNFAYKISFCNEQSFLVLNFCQLSETDSSHHVIYFYFSDFIEVRAAADVFTEGALRQLTSTVDVSKSCDDLHVLVGGWGRPVRVSCVFLCAKINCISTGHLRPFS